MDFIGRQAELEVLEKEFNKGKFAFSVIYGRRRVGKTFLIQEFIKDKKGYYFVAVESNELINLKLLSESIYLACGGLVGLPAFNDIESALRYLFEYSMTHRLAFVIDEFPYLAESIPSVSSVIQNLIDEYKSSSQLFFILCGSSMSFMEEQVLGYKSPLYGRRTSQLKIRPFNYLEAGQFVKSYTPKEKAIVFGLTNGIADYLTFFDDQMSLEENIINLYFTPSGRLFEEATNLLKQELRQLKTYNDILFAIATGSSKLNEIATKLQVASGSLSHYLKALIDLEIIEKNTPVMDRKSKRPVYRIQDTMFLFWYRFVQINLNLINLGLGERVLENNFSDVMQHYMGRVFEKITFQYYERRILENKVPFLPTDYGNWWGNDPILKKQSEIDLLAVNSSDQMLFVEAKWRKQPVTKEVLEELIQKSKVFPASQTFYWLTSLSGFEKINSNFPVELIDLEKMYQ